MISLNKEDLLSLSISERIQLVEDIWDSIAEIPDELHLSEDQKAELDRRLHEYQDDPEAGSPWEVVRDRIRNQK